VRFPAAGAPAGLTSIEAAELLRVHGPNTVPGRRRQPAWRRLVGEMSHFFAAMLWVAAVLAVVAGLAQLGVAIVVVIVVNGLFAFVQEERAEHAAERLRDLLPTGVRVRRDGSATTVDSREVVPGDVVLLDAGDRVPADLSLVAADGMLVDESMLTGESVPAAVGPGDVAHAGTFVVGGEGEGVVSSTGAGTRLAEIERLTSGVHRRPSPLALEIHRIVRTLASIAVGVGAGFFVLSWLLGMPASDGFLFAIGVTVALVPEGLLPTVTLSLAVGAQRMAGHQALVRHLEAVETLGSTTFICTDKTGTLTRNQMSVIEVWTPRGPVHVEGDGYSPVGTAGGDPDALEAAVRAADAGRVSSRGRVRWRDGAWVPVGDPMEAAIDALAHRLRGAEELEEPRWERRFPFDPRRRCESVISGGRVVVKGAPDALLPRCLDPGDAHHAVEALAARGLRVLAVAGRSTNGVEPQSADSAEQGLELLGLFGLEDPPRPTVARALQSCRTAGVRVAMVTGDHPTTARTIAEQIGLLGPDQMVLRGDDLPDDDAVLGALLDRDGVVLSRVSPEQKLRVARVLQDRGHVVAMTGDGINDAPALREADIGVAMGCSGTDVAREAADLVLLDDDFSTIVRAIEQGRGTFANLRRFLTYHLTDNVAELTPFVVWALSGGRFPLALGVLQILFLDIGTDLVPALALGTERPDPEVLNRPPERRHLIDGALIRRVFGALGPTEAVMEMFAFVVALIAAGWVIGGEFPTDQAVAAASGAAFASVVVGQSANGFACRSDTKPPWELGWGTNRLLLFGVALAAAFLCLALTVPAFAGLLGQVAPPAVVWPAILLSAPAVLVVDTARKRRQRHSRRRHGGT
jgi:magnesium-transporting ATPase (P-type)